MPNRRIDDGLTLVLGGTGKTGRRVAERLWNLGRPVRLGSRSAIPGFDWDNRATWTLALQGVHAAYVTFQPDLAVAHALAALQAFFARAIDSGVKRIVLLSSRGEAQAEQAERALRALNVEWTILRASWFCQNFSEGCFLDPLLAGELAVPVDAISEPFVDADDIADVAVAALTQRRHALQLYELTGPRSLTFAEAAAEVAVAAGRDIGYIAVSPYAYRAALVQAQVPSRLIDLTLRRFATLLDGRNSRAMDGVQRALGRAPRDFADYARRAAAAGAWTVQFS